MKLDKNFTKEKNGIKYLYIQLGQFLLIPDNTLHYVVILSHTYQFQTMLTNSEQYLPIPNNTYQFLTIPKKPGFSWYRLVSTKHQASLPISSWCHHNTVLVVFCLSGIIMVLILPIFTKPLMLSTRTRLLHLFLPTTVL
jgi:hypothetical protein